MEVDTGDCSMICTDHPFKNTTPSGGICAFCLQEKLGKLVTSSFPITVFPTSSSSSPSFRSDNYNNTNTTTTGTTITNNNNHILGLGSGSNNIHYSNPNPNRSRIMYLLGRKSKNKNKNKEVLAHLQNNIIQNNNNIVLKRSKSSYDHNHPPKRGGGLWSFLYLNPTGKKTLKPSASMRTESTMSYNDINNINIVVEENDDDVAFDRKVSRSRSVGCGSRSFSGDFFERISTGFGDCALRRVESQREGKPGINERVRCGGLFSGFMITSSSSSSTSSFGSNNNNNNNNENENENENEGSVIGGRVTSAGVGTRQQQHLHARSKSWGWALASPMRAFKKNPNPKPNPKQKPNLAAVPSLLSVGR